MIAYRYITITAAQPFITTFTGSALLGTLVTLALVLVFVTRPMLQGQPFSRRVVA